MREEIRIKGVYLKTTANEVREIDYSDLKESDEVCRPKEFLEAIRNGESGISFFDGSSEELYDEVMRIVEQRKKEVENLSREVFYHFFCDEYGNQLSGHPDQLAVSRKRVVERFPQTAEWPVLGEHGDRFGYVLGNGVFLFPDFDFANPAFTAI